jgi:diguanylate cyclase (GGDEF)-like protein
MQAQIFTFVIPAMALIFAAVLGVLWWQRRDELHILAYSYCFGSMAIGVMLNIWLIGAVGLSGLIAYHLLSMSGIIALMWGASRRAGQNIPMAVYIFTVAIACVLLAVAGSVNDIETMKLIQNVSSALLIAMAAQNLWHTKKRHLADFALVWVLAIFSGFGFIRPVLTDLSPVFFGQGEQGLALLTSLHALIMTVMTTLIALCLISSVIADNMAEQRRRAERDPLSGLRMRSSFESQAAMMMERAQDKSVPLSLIIADLDHFKLVNDRYGHPMGDKVIAAVGEKITGAIRSKDIAGRLGGEEFGILLWNCNEEAASAMANRLRLQIQGIGSAIEVDGLRCSASFGVMEWTKRMSFPRVFELTDRRLYGAKNNGRNQVCSAEKSDKANQKTAPLSADDEGARNVVAIPKLGVQLG